MTDSKKSPTTMVLSMIGLGLILWGSWSMGQGIGLIATGVVVMAFSAFLDDA